MSETGRRIIIFGGRGYLGRELIKKLEADPLVNVVFDIDLQNKETWVEKSKVWHLHGSILEPWQMIKEFLNNNSIDTVVLLAWWFNPTHRLKAQWRVNVEGTKNVVKACLNSNTVKYLFYTGSTTAYGQLPNDPREESLDEKDWHRNGGARLNAAYPYSRQKAEVDFYLQSLQGAGVKDFRFGWMRGAIVAGKNTRNVVTNVAEAFSPFMFRASGYDPPMQFVSERDMAEVLYWAVMEKWIGPVNVAGTDTVKYSEVIKLLGKKEIVLPFWLLYAFCWLGWNIRIGDRSLLKFPPSILHLISKPWVGSIQKLRHKCGYEPFDSSVDAILQLKEGLGKKRDKKF